MKVRNVRANEKIELQMTPMIDIVFQLLVFFVMTFKIVAMEGDFNIKMPVSAPSEGAVDEPELPPMKLRLKANADGTIASIILNETAFQAFDGQDGNSLHEHIMAMVGSNGGPSSALAGAEIEMDCDYNLRYEYVIEAITAVTGHRTSDGNIVKLIEKVNFAPPKEQ